MPVVSQWENAEKTVIRAIYSGHIVLDDHYHAIDRCTEMLGEVEHKVHYIFDRTAIVTAPTSLASVLRYAQRRLPDNLDMTIVIKANTFTRAAVNLARVIAPVMVRELYLVETLDEAYALIEKYEASREGASLP